MENVKITLENGTQIDVLGIFYVFNSKYYFIYTLKELDENDYVKLYVVQVCKEIQNTPTGPIDTGNMLGMEISNPEEWGKVQQSITKIVEDKKNNTQSSEIQYLPMNMLVNLKIISKNKFKLMKQIVEENFKVNIISNVAENNNANETINIQPIDPMQITIPNQISTPTLANESSNNNTGVPLQNLSVNENTATPDINNNLGSNGDVIIDYRAKLFEEQEKNSVLEEQIKLLNEKLDSIKQILG